MNPTAIFSKSGKGVQEASGKTSQLSRPDRAVLSAIDGRATLGEVAQKCGKQFDNDFKSLITKLDKDGFVREVSPGAAAPAGGGAKPAAAAPAKPAPSKPTAPMDMASDLDFTAAMSASPKKGPAAPPPQAVARAPAPPPKPTVAVPAAPPPPSAAEKAKQEIIAKEQQSAFAKAREEAERKQQEDRDRVKSEAEAKIRAETEAKLRVEAEEKAKADAEAKAMKAEADAIAARSSAIRAAAEAKVKAEAEAKRAREDAERVKREAEEKAQRARQEAERVKREAEEKAERARKEAEEKARREQEELKRKLEEERRAREEAERKAKEEAERARRELEEERRKMEAERKQREEQQRQEEEERATRRKREEEEEQERRRQRDEQEETERAARRKLRDEEEERERAERDSRKREEEAPLFEEKAKEAAPPPPPPKAKAAAATGDAFADSLLADLDSFTQRDDDDRKAKEDSERKAKEDAARKRQEEADRKEREEADARQRAEDERRRKDEEARAAREAEERRALEEKERAEKEAEERRRKMSAGAAAAAPAGGDDIGITDDDLQLDEVKREAALLDKKKNRKEEREKEREKERAQKKERDREAKNKKDKERDEKEAKKSAAAYRPRRKSNLGRNVTLGLFLLLIIGAGVVHVMPVSTAEYEKAATEALGRPVKIGSGRFSLIGGVQYKFEGVNVGGDLNIPVVRAFPEIGSVFSEKKIFTRVELEGMSLPQEALGDILFAKPQSDSLTISQVTLRGLKLSGVLPLPPLDGEVQLERGAIRSATLRGGEGLVAKLSAKERSMDFDVSTTQFTLPFAPAVTLVQFAMKGEATRQGLKVAQWDGLLFSGHLTGTANMRWGNTWEVDGVMTARGMNAAVFAPALMSSGRAEGTGRFSMSGVEPVKLGSSARLEGSFTVAKGVLGSFDLSRALQTGGRQLTGQTQFAEMSGQGVYDRGAVSLRNINLGAGALNAGASLDISESGALSGRIVADVKTSSQNLRSTLIVGGTVQEPQVRN